MRIKWLLAGTTLFLALMLSGCVDWTVQTTQSTVSTQPDPWLPDDWSPTLCYVKGVDNTDVSTWINRWTMGDYTIVLTEGRFDGNVLGEYKLIATVEHVSGERRNYPVFVHVVDNPFIFRLADSNDHYLVSAMHPVLWETITVPSTHLGLPVSGVASLAFFRPTPMVKVIWLPSSIRYLEGSAFYGAPFEHIGFLSEASLETIPARAFEATARLKRFTVPKSVKSIQMGAFRMSGLSEILFEEGSMLQDIEESAFSELTQLKTIRLPASVTSIGRHAFAIESFTSSQLTDIVFDNGSALRYLGDHAFMNAAKVVTLSLPVGLETIGIGALQGMNSLESLSTPFVGQSRNEEEFTTIGHFFGLPPSAYSNIIPSSLRSLTITDTLDLGKDALRGAYMIEHLTLPSQLQSIGDSALREMNSLTEIAFPTSLNSIGDYALYHTGLQGELIIPYKLETIGRSAFEGCDKIDRITFMEPSWLLRIDVRAFASLNLVKELVLPRSLGEIGIEAFAGWDSLETLSVPFIGTARYAVLSPLIHLFTSAIDRPENVPPRLTSVSVTSDYIVRTRSFMNIPQITVLTLNEGITIIEGQAFEGLSNLSVLELPSTVQSIGTAAFMGMSKLKRLTIPDGVQSMGISVFYDLPMLEHLQIPFLGTAMATSAQGTLKAMMAHPSPANSSLKTVTLTRQTVYGDSAFEGFSGLTSIVIPEETTSIGAYAFQGIYGIRSLRLPSAITSIGEYAFANMIGLHTVVLPEGLINIGNHSFENNEYLSHLHIPSTVTSIGAFAFANANRLSELTFAPNSSLRLIGEYAFMNTVSLLELSLPENVEIIKAAAFSGSVSLSTIHLPSTIRILHSDAFYGAVVTELILPEGLVELMPGALAGLTQLTKAIIPDQIQSIHRGVFKGNTAIRELIVPFLGMTSAAADAAPLGYLFTSSNDITMECTEAMSSLIKVTLTKTTHLAAKAFSTCSFLETVQLPEGLVEIGASAFSRTTALKELTLPDGLRVIGRDAFLWSGIETIAIPSSVESLGSGMFRYSSIRHLTLPFIGPSRNVTEQSTLSFLYGGSSSSTCYELTIGMKPSVVLSEGTTVPSYAFAYCQLTNVSLPSTISTISPYAFYLTRMKELVFSESMMMERLGEYALSGLYAEQLTFPSSLRVLEDRSCINIGVIQLTLNEGLQTIGMEAFMTMSQGNVLRIPGTVTSIFDRAFLGAYGLTGILFEESSLDLVIGDRAFDQAVIQGNLHLPARLIQIGDSAFANNRLTSISFAESPRLSVIGASAFAGNPLSGSVTLPDSVVEMGDQAFAFCRSIENMFLPLSLTIVGQNILFSNEIVIIHAQTNGPLPAWHEDWNDGLRPVVWANSQPS